MDIDDLGSAFHVSS